MGAGRGRLVTGMHCAWFHVFDFVGQLQWLGLRSCRFHVGAGAFGAWLCLWEITRVFGKNNLVPTVTASFDVLEAGDMVEGCSFGFSLGFWRVRTVRNFLLVKFLCLRVEAPRHPAARRPPAPARYPSRGTRPRA